MMFHLILTSVLQRGGLGSPLTLRIGEYNGVASLGAFRIPGNGGPCRVDG